MPDALPLQQRALALRQGFDRDHSDVGISLNNLALIYFQMGDFETAVPYFERAIEICIKILGESHRRTITTLGNLGLCYRKLGETSKAEEIEARALSLQKGIK